MSLKVSILKRAIGDLEQAAKKDAALKDDPYTQLALEAYDNKRIELERG